MESVEVVERRCAPTLSHVGSGGEAAASNWLTANQRETWEATEPLKTNLLSAETITDISHNKEARRGIITGLCSVKSAASLPVRGGGVHRAAAVHLGFFYFFQFHTIVSTKEGNLQCAFLTIKIKQLKLIKHVIKNYQRKWGVVFYMLMIQLRHC